MGRRGHGVIQVNDEFIVIGGTRSGYIDEPIESCKLKRKSMICITKKPILSKFTHYPELMLVP